MSRQLKVDRPYRPRSEAFCVGARARAQARWADPAMRARMLDGRAAAYRRRVAAREESKAVGRKKWTQQLADGGSMEISSGVGAPDTLGLVLVRVDDTTAAAAAVWLTAAEAREVARRLVAEADTVEGRVRNE